MFLFVPGDYDAGDLVYRYPHGPGGPYDASHVSPLHAHGDPAQVSGHPDSCHARVQAVAQQVRLRHVLSDLRW